MKNISPSCSDTTVNFETMEWIPNSFDRFLQELNHIVKSCKQADSLALFRGHRKREWLLDSTFVRSFKATLFGLPAGEKLSKRIVESFELHQSLLNLYLLKFGVLVRPTDKLESIAVRDSVDAWFELMKRFQQYPNKDGFFLKGTNLIDWTQSPDVALYFANDNSDCDGAIYICDATATGKTLQIIPLGAILDKMNELGKAGKPLGAPLLFCPRKQIKSVRARNQQAVYFAQMDLRYDLESFWRMQEAEVENETIIIKLVLPAGNNLATKKYLDSKDITREFIYPDE